MNGFPAFRILIIALCLAFTGTAQAKRTASMPVAVQAKVKTFKAMMVKKHGYDAKELDRLFGKVRYRQKIIDAISRPAEGKPWHDYRNIFLKQRRVDAGIKFWRKHAAILKKVEAHYGVPAEMIVAIIGVETFYGRQAGGYPVIDALTTLGFGYPRRAKFFSKELEEWLLLCKKEKLDCSGVKGSYAGAMGIPQFIPSSYRAYAVDFNKDGRRDLLNSPEDAIASVANYFVKHGWKTRRPVAVPAYASGKGHSKYENTGLKADLQVKQLKKLGVQPWTYLPPQTKVGLLRYRIGKKSQEHWLGLHNFYVITTYNRSRLYAMATFQLSQALVANWKISDEKG